MKKIQIKALREDRKLKQQELANIIGINRTYLSAIETGTILPTIDTLLKISRALHCEYTDLYKDEDLEIIKNNGGRASNTPSK